MNFTAVNPLKKCLMPLDVSKREMIENDLKNDILAR